MYWTDLRLISIQTTDFPIVGVQPTDPFILKDLEGLGPPPVTVTKTKTRQQGSLYQTREPEDKQLVARIGLNPDWSTGQTASDLRIMLYDLLYGSSADAPVIIQIIDKVSAPEELAIFITTGWVSKIIINPFSPDPEVQVTLECLGPYFSDANPDGFNVDTDELDKELPVIDNVGNAPVGFYARVKFTDDVDDWTLYNSISLDRLGANDREMHFEFSFLEDDELEISTIAGDKYVRVKRGFTFTNLLSKLPNDDSFEWIQIHNGVNHWRTSDQNFDWEELNYFPQYWGV